MKNLIILACCTMFSVVAVAQSKILIAGSGWDKVGMIDEVGGKLEWEFPILKGEDCNDIELTKGGDILIACKTSARMVRWDKSVVWEYVCKENEEINTATELNGKLAKDFGGKYMLAICGKPSRIVILNKKAEEISHINFESGVDNAHGQFRQVLPTEGGKFIVPIMGKGEVVEFDHNGAVLKRVKVGGNPFSVKVSDSGEWIVSCGDGHKIVFVDPVSEKIVRTIGEDDFSGLRLLFVSELHAKADGSMFLTNWSGHANDNSQPKLFKVDAKGDVVWKLPSMSEITNISALYIMPSHAVKK
ncbi:MAG: hypothetical protein RR277_00830 [Rikenellaceae bacterium]